ncbi:MAG: hypothetical protein KKC84_06240 [Candidatus Omnitrophica bacterium]|nr:hypothetical protein [Candidatus Omnitrophota bacterium]
MKIIRYLLLIVACAILQAGIFPYLKVYGAGPDLLLVMGGISHFLFVWPVSLFLSIFAGVLKDVLSLSGFGLHTGLFVAWSFCVRYLNRHIAIETDRLRVGVMAIILVLNAVITGSISVLRGTAIPWPRFLSMIAVQTLYSLLLLPNVIRFSRMSLTLSWKIRLPMFSFRKNNES